MQLKMETGNEKLLNSEGRAPLGNCLFVCIAVSLCICIYMYVLVNVCVSVCVFGWQHVDDIDVGGAPLSS